jgi:hypothetical protein
MQRHSLLGLIWPALPESGFPPRLSGSTGSIPRRLHFLARASREAACSSGFSPLGPKSAACFVRLGNRFWHDPGGTSSGTVSAAELAAIDVVGVDCDSSDAAAEREPDLVVASVMDATAQTRERGLLGHSGELLGSRREEGGQYGRGGPGGSRVAGDVGGEWRGRDVGQPVGVDQPTDRGDRAK